MRHITVLLLGGQGKTLTTIQDMVGHLIPAMSEHYLHILERSRRELAERWGGGDHIEAATKNLGDFYNQSTMAWQMAEIDADSKIATRRLSARE